MVKCETGFRKLANNRRGNSRRKRLHLPKNRSNPHGNLEVDEIADNSIVDIDLIIEVEDEEVSGPSPSGLQNNQEVSSNISANGSMLHGTNEVISEET